MSNKTKKDTKKNKDKTKNVNNEETIIETQNLDYSKKENINLDNSDKKHLAVNSARSNEIECLNIEMNKSNTTGQNDSKIINDVNKRETNPNSIKVQIEEKIEDIKKDKNEDKKEKENEEMFKLYKVECDRIIDKMNKEDKLYNSLFNKEISDKKKKKRKIKLTKDYLKNIWIIVIFILFLKK